jgi:hypothetical protein
MYCNKYHVEGHRLKDSSDLVLTVVNDPLIWVALMLLGNGFEVTF